MESDVNIKEGYKKTAVGVIPEEWGVKSFKDVTKRIGDGIHSTPKYDLDGMYFFINGNNLRNGKVFIDDKTKRVNKDEYLKHVRELSDRTILMSINGTIGDLAFYKNEDIVLGKSACYLNVDDNYKIRYIYYQLDSYNIQNNFLRKTTGSTIRNLGINEIRNTKLPIPPLPEQKAIANCLTTWDSGIEKLSALIKAKKELKKGLMQQLLTGEKRLDGFEGEWKEVKLGELCSMSTGKLNANAMVDKGLYRFYTCAKEHFYINHYAFDTEALLISGNGANVGYIHYYKGKFNAYQRTYVLDKFNQSILYIKYYLDEKLEHRILKEKNEGNTPYIVLSTLQQMKIILPSLSEQTAIAEVLTTADKEITLLEKKLERFKEQKRGLMQVLLTGGRRLITQKT